MGAAGGGGKREEIRPRPEWGVGVFDSGLGGLSIVREIVRELPDERIVYYADTRHMPFGPRPLAEVREIAFGIVERLLAAPVKAVVVACNTASAAALKALRLAFAGVIFVGMEPAVKPAAAETRSGKVGVLATQAAFQGELFESVVARFAAGVEVIRQPCPGLAEFIESHPPDHPALRPRLEKFILPLVERGVDEIVLACTHYPLAMETIKDICGPGVRVVDPSPAIARRLRQVLAERRLLASSGGGGLESMASGDPAAFSRQASLILGREISASPAEEFAAARFLR